MKARPDTRGANPISQLSASIKRSQRLGLPEISKLRRDFGGFRPAYSSQLDIDNSPKLGIAAKFERDLSIGKIGRTRGKSLTVDAMQATATESAGMFDQKHHGARLADATREITFGTSSIDAQEAAHQQVRKRECILSADSCVEKRVRVRPRSCADPVNLNHS
jgi:hypothetical protein